MIYVEFSVLFLNPLSKFADFIDEKGEKWHWRLGKFGFAPILSAALASDLDLSGSSSTLKTVYGVASCAFSHHTDMMTVILRIDSKRLSNRPSPKCLDFTHLSYFLSVEYNLAPTTSLVGTIWHIGCPKYGREGLRVL